VRVLQGVSEAPPSVDSLTEHNIIEVLQALQEPLDATHDDVCQLEWRFLPLFSTHDGTAPKLLEQRLADDPEFFCDLIRAVFRAKKQERPAEEITTQQRNIAEYAFRLLRNWRRPPGYQKGGAYVGDALRHWLKQVKASCAESGHLEVALEQVGRALVYAPSDPDGLWLHHSASQELNAKDVNDMRDGFCAELFNSRGFFWGTEGREERELAAKNRSKADDLEAKGYHRLANSLRGLASSYEHEAERQAARGSADD
jgi:hypothetical protein